MESYWFGVSTSSVCKLVVQLQKEESFNLSFSVWVYVCSFKVWCYWVKGYFVCYLQVYTLRIQTSILFDSSLYIHPPILYNYSKFKLFSPKTGRNVSISHVNVRFIPFDDHFTSRIFDKRYLRLHRFFKTFTILIFISVRFLTSLRPILCVD